MNVRFFYYIHVLNRHHLLDRNINRSFSYFVNVSFYPRTFIRTYFFSEFSKSLYLFGTGVGTLITFYTQTNESKSTCMCQLWIQVTVIHRLFLLTIFDIQTQWGVKVYNFGIRGLTTINLHPGKPLLLQHSHVESTILITVIFFFVFSLREGDDTLLCYFSVDRCSVFRRSGL